jgi:uncharacterized protein (TIGR01244 family)
MPGASGSRLRRFTERLTLGGAVGIAELHAAAETDHHMVIDLRTDPEVATVGIDPAAEEQCATALGLDYRRIPVSTEEGDDEPVSRVRALLRDADRRVLLHCTDAARAAALALIHLACDEGASLGECYAIFRTLELPAARRAAVVSWWVGYILDHAAHDDRRSDVPGTEAAGKARTAAREQSDKPRQTNGIRIRHTKGES